MTTTPSATAPKGPALAEGALAMFKAEHDAVSHLFAGLRKRDQPPKQHGSVVFVLH